MTALGQLFQRDRLRHHLLHQARRGGFRLRELFRGDGHRGAQGVRGEVRQLIVKPELLHAPGFGFGAGLLVAYVRQAL